MAFKYRLQIFFVILTILPLLAAGWAISGISAKNRTNRTDQQLAITLSAAEVSWAQDKTAATTMATQLASTSQIQNLLANPSHANNTSLGKLLTAAQAGANFRLAAFGADGTQIAGIVPQQPAFRVKTSVAGSGSIVAAESVPAFLQQLKKPHVLPSDQQIVARARTDGVLDRRPSRARRGGVAAQLARDDDDAARQARARYRDPARHRCVPGRHHEPVGARQRDPLDPPARRRDPARRDDRDRHPRRAARALAHGHAAHLRRARALDRRRALRPAGAHARQRRVRAVRPGVQRHVSPAGTPDRRARGRATARAGRRRPFRRRPGLDA